MRSGMTWKLAFCLGLSLAAVGCQTDDPSGVLPGAAVPGFVATNNLAPAPEGAAVLDPVSGGQASSAGTEADARMAELVATAVLASFDSGNAGMVSALSGLGSASSGSIGSAAGIAKAGPAGARAAASVVVAATLSRWKAAARQGAARLSLSSASRRPYRRKPRAPGKSPAVAPADREIVIMPYPLPDPGGLPDPGPVLPGVITTGPGGEAVPGQGWIGPNRPYPGWNGDSVEPGGAVTGGQEAVDPNTGPPGPYPDYQTRPPQGPGSEPGSSAGASGFTTLADGFEFQDGATALVFHGVTVRWDAAGVPVAVAFAGPVRVQGQVSREDGSLTRLRLGLTGLTGVVRAPAEGETMPSFEFDFAEGGVTLLGQIDATDFTLAVSGARGQARSLDDVTRLLAASTLSVTASARNLGTEVGTLAVDARVRHPRLGLDGGGAFSAEAVWGRATVGFGPASEPLLKEGVQAVTLTVDESHALAIAADGRLVSGTADVELSHADGRRNRLTVTAAEGRLDLDGTLLSGGGATERVETAPTGQVRVTGQARLRDGSTERHEVEFAGAETAGVAGRGPARVTSRLTDAQGRERAEVQMRLGADRTGEGSWRDLQQAGRQGTFRVDAAGVVHLLGAQGAELATARLARSGS